MRIISFAVEVRHAISAVARSTHSIAAIREMVYSIANGPSIEPDVEHTALHDIGRLPEQSTKLHTVYHCISQIFAMDLLGPNMLKRHYHPLSLFFVSYCCPRWLWEKLSVWGQVSGWLLHLHLFCPFS